MSRPIQAGEAGRVITATDLGVDWADLGYTLKFRVTLGSGDPEDYDMSAVGGNVYQATVTTTAAMFPTAGSYRCQVVSFLAASEKLKSNVITIVVVGNT